MESHDFRIGERFNHWTIIDDKSQKIQRKSGTLKGYLCECDCHNKTHKIVEKYALLYGHSKSCGCIRRTTHGMSHTKFYQQYHGMIKRCELKTHKEYKDYGGRGISVCDEWRNDFQTFYDWAMNHGYKDGLTIDRIDVNGNYSTQNCRWIPLSKQMSNKRNNITLEFEGRKMTLKEWSKQKDINVPYGTILRRYHNKWDVKDILFKEIKK